MLFWTFCLLTFMQCVAGLAVSTLCRSFLIDNDHDIETRKEIFKYYGILACLGILQGCQRQIARVEGSSYHCNDFFSPANPPPWPCATDLIPWFVGKKLLGEMDPMDVIKFCRLHPLVHPTRIVQRKCLFPIGSQHWHVPNSPAQPAKYGRRKTTPCHNVSCRHHLAWAGFFNRDLETVLSFKTSLQLQKHVVISWCWFQKENGKEPSQCTISLRVH